MEFEVETDNLLKILMPIIGLLFGMLVVLRPLVTIHWTGDGDNETTVTINIGLINIPSVNFNDNSHNLPEDDD